MEYDPKGIPFPDTFVTQENSRIILRPHTKPTDTKQYINPESCHPKHIFESLPYSQALRLQRICTKQTDLEDALDNLKHYLMKRGYNGNSVERNFNKIHSPKNKNKNKRKEKITMIIPYHPSNPPLAKILHQTWSKHKASLPENIEKPITAYRRPKNLKEMLTKAKYSDNMDMLPPKQRDKTKMSIKSLDKYNIHFDKHQLEALITHVKYTCKCGWHLISDEHNTLQEAMDNSPPCPYSQKVYTSDNRCTSNSYKFYNNTL
jgi:hypothetical protein